MYEVTWTKHKRLENLINQVDKLDKQTVDIGYFSEQGNHPESPHLSFPSLMAIHENRHKNDPMRRPVFEIAVRENGINIYRQSILTIKDFVDKSAINRKLSPKTVLDKIGIVGIQNIKPIFGDTSLLHSNKDGVIRSKGRNSPMIEFGILKESLAYKTSLRKSIKTFN